MISFKGRHFMKPVIMMLVRWYLAYALSYRNIEELMEGPGLSVDHNTSALTEVNKTLTEAEKIKIRQNKYLNNMIEQDHRFVKKITKPMLNFKSMHSARATLDGIELHHMLRKGQHVNSESQSIFEQFHALAA